MTFEDQPDGQVKVTTTPSANEVMAKFKNRESELTPAESMVCMCILRILAESKKANYNERKIHLIN